jgi:hypothetical protein
MRCPVLCRQNPGTSHEVGCSTECCERRPCGPIGLPRGHVDVATFSRVPVARRPASSPAPLRKRVHPPSSLASSSEYGPLRTCPAHGCERRLPWGFRPNRDVSCGDPLAGEDPNLTLRSAPGVSHTLDGFLSPRPRGLVSSHCHVRDSPFRGLFPPPSQRASSTSRALLSFAVVACRRLASSVPAPVASPSGP